MGGHGCLQCPYHDIERHHRHWGVPVNLSSCPGCGDTHLCPGQARLIEAGPALVEQVRLFADDTFTVHATGVIGTAEAYTAYLDWCTRHESPAYSQKRFVQAMQALRIRRIKRSTMRFQGITWKDTTPQGRHAAREPEFAGSSR